MFFSEVSQLSQHDRLIKELMPAVPCVIRFTLIQQCFARSLRQTNWPVIPPSVQYFLLRAQTGLDAHIFPQEHHEPQSRKALQHTNASHVVNVLLTDGFSPEFSSSPDRRGRAEPSAEEASAGSVIRPRAVTRGCDTCSPSREAPAALRIRFLREAAVWAEGAGSQEA